MLYLQELFDDLAYGEFANVAAGRTQTTMIDPAQYPKMVSILNAGLLAIYTELPIRKKKFDLYQREGITTYTISLDHVGDVDGGDPQIYIDDTEDALASRAIIKILEAEDELGLPIWINDRKYPDDLFNKEQHVFYWKTPESLDDYRVATIQYQARYPRIEVTEGFDPTSVELDIPDFIKLPLLNWMASRFYMGMKTNVGEESLSNAFFRKYLLEMQTVKDRYLVPEVSQTADNQFEERGWI